MNMRRGRMLLLALPGLLAVAGSRAAGRNIAPDAVTRATTWNTFEGDLAALSDGRAGGEDGAAPFTWRTKGILVFEWDEVVPLERVRVYVGRVGNDYQVRTYVGGRLDDTGTGRDSEGERTALVSNHERRANGWREIPLPPGTRADNLELWTLGSTVFHEVEILVRGDDTSVQGPSWGQVKGAASGTRESPTRWPAIDSVTFIALGTNR